MATLVLTVVGGIIGGPIGAAIGGAIGNAIDRDVIFRPKGREGPRLTDLSVQTSSYGTPIQKMFGTMRVAGSVIWSTDLIESRQKQSGGKGQPSVTTYSYSASFAVLLSARPILGVGRIWAEGKLLRGAAGDFKSATGSTFAGASAKSSDGFRLHPGGEEQAADPLIASAEGAGLTPAHRGSAYAVFENLQLADYGNRIPSLTFEVIADAGPVSAGVIAGELGGGAIDGSDVIMPVPGFAAYGDSIRGVVETLADASGAWFAPAGDGVAMRTSIAPEHDIGDDGFAEGDKRGARGTRALAAIETVPRTITIGYYDPARDYQTGLQRARRPGAGGREDRIEAPAVLSADAAKTIAVAALDRAETARERRTVALGWRDLAVTPGSLVSIAGVAGTWRVSGWSFEGMVLTLECVRLAEAAAPASGIAGRVSAAADAVAGTTILHAFETLPFDDSVLAAPRLTVAAAGTGTGWRRAALLYSLDRGASWTTVGATAAPATIGTLASVPGPAATAIVDRANAFEVELAHPGMTLAGADDAALDAGANLALAGDELLQFGVAEQIGAARWRLSRLLRGRRGTEAAVGTQAAGDRFVLIEADAALAIDLPLAAIGGEVRLMASGIGDLAGPAEMSLTLRGTSVLPPAPVHLAADLLASGDAVVRWVRRSRAGWRWIGGADAPLAEEREAYAVTITGAGGARTIETPDTAVTVMAAERSAAVHVAVRQRGTNGQSAAAAIDLPVL